MKSFDGRRYSLTSIRNCLISMGFTLKYVKRIHARRCHKQELAFRENMAAVDARNMVFLDEVHVTKRDMNRHRGWAMKGQRAGNDLG